MTGLSALAGFLVVMWFSFHPAPAAAQDALDRAPAANAVPEGQSGRSDSVLDRALDAELVRAKGLGPDGYPPPYYAGLAAVDIDLLERACSMGKLRYAAGRRQRSVTPDVRVGSPELDNHPIAVSAELIGRSLPFDDDEFALRHGLWQLLDQAYKRASADFLRKQALRVSRGKAEYDTDDFTREPPDRKASLPPAGGWSAEGLERLCLETSRAFRRSPGLLHAEVAVSLARERWRLRDTEGLRVDFPRDVAEIELEAVDIATDGLKVSASRSFYALSERALPGAAELEAEARSIMADLAALKVAQTTSPFDAPAILDPSIAAAVVWSLGARLSGEEQRNPGGTQVFREKLGKKVMPSFLSLVDDPTLAEFGGRPLVGSFAFDNQGVPSQRVVLVERGVLKGFLLSRFPVLGFGRSNGHARRPPGYMPVALPANLLLEPAVGSSRVPEDRLFEMLLQELRRRRKPQGFWVRKLKGIVQQAGGRQDSIRILARLVYLVDAKTGARTLVRNLDVVGTPLVLMESILAAGDKLEVVDLLGGGPVSVVAPSLLVGGVELQRSEARPEKPPILPPPPVD